MARCAGHQASAQDVSGYCASRRFMWRVAHLHLFITRVAQEAWRGAAR
ncbi:hypothetical protein A2U01_0083997, partial [Trifolium medium]|nr:hypothetical protein [Trifolium medium]